MAGRNRGGEGLSQQLRELNPKLIIVERGEERDGCFSEGVCVGNLQPPVTMPPAALPPSRRRNGHVSCFSGNVTGIQGMAECQNAMPCLFQ